LGLRAGLRDLLDPKWTKVIVIAVVGAVATAGVTAYYVTTRSSCGSLKSTNPIVADQAEAVDTADPGFASSTPDWGLVQQIYQTLIMYNASSQTNYSGVLAQNWTTSPDGFHWNFTLRQGVHFSNGDPFNAYVMWLSLYRLLDTVGINQYLLSQNFWYPQVWYYNTTNQSNASLTNLTTDLNTFNFDSPTAAQIAVMSADNQSFRVLSPSVIQVNLGFGYLDYTFASDPYAFLLAELSTPGAAAIDPNVLQAHGGQQPGQRNLYLASNAVGTGPYLLTSYSTVSGYTLTPDPNYWGRTVAAQEPWNNNIQPGRATIEVNFQSTEAVTLNNLNSGTVATASFFFNDPAAINSLKKAGCVVVESLPQVFSGANGAWWVYMNQSTFPFTNLSVRAAITHAINYPEVIALAFGGYGTSWVGPVPPGHPYYNPANLTPYQYNLTLAQQEIANSPCANNACKSLIFNYMYLNTGTNWADAAQIIQQNLAVIGITTNPVGLSLSQFYTAQTIDPSTGKCVSAENQFGGPFFIGQDFYSSDYISPDDWTQNDALSFGSANICNSGFGWYVDHPNNLTAGYPGLDQSILNATGQSNPTVLAQDYANLTEFFYYNYTNAWFVTPTLFTVSNPAVHGFLPYQTPMGSTELNTMQWNTVYAT
jgi:peptide/nickel transport system substrate-binding protein